MPLYKTLEISQNTTLYVWKIEESFDTLIHDTYLNENSLKRVNNMKSELHRRGFLSVRHLLKAAGYSDKDLYYSDNGKPHLKDGKHISITHSFIFSAIIISDEEVGVDIEKNRAKIKRIAHKFVEFENNYISKNNRVEQLTVIWGAKESIYKIDPENGYSFKDSIFIKPFEIAAKKTIGRIVKGNYVCDFKIYFEKIEDFSLVYALK